MRSFQPGRAAYVVVVVCGLAFAPALAQEPGADDRRAIEALVEKINLAWKSDSGQEIMQSVISDKAAAIALPDPSNPAQAAVLDKTVFCRAFARLLENSRPKSHVHEIHSVAIVGLCACEIGVTEQVAADGQRRTDAIMNVFAKEDVGWRLVFSMPANSDEQTVRQLAQAYVGMARTESPTPLAVIENMLADDCVLMTKDGNVHRGKRTILRLFQDAIPQMRAKYRRIEARFDIESIRVFPTTAVVRGRIVGTALAASETIPLHVEVLETMVFEKIGDQWKMIHEHSTIARSPDTNADRG